MVRPERIELPTSWFVAMRSIQLSYGRNFDGLRLGIIAETKTVRPNPSATSRKKSRRPKEIKLGSWKLINYLARSRVNTLHFFETICARSSYVS